LNEVLYVVAFIIGLQFPNSTDEVIVQHRGIDHGLYYTKEECETSLKEYGPEYIMNEFMSGLIEDPDVVPFPKTMPMCIRYNTRTAQYPDYPQFDVPVNHPNDGQGVNNDGLGRPVS
jgi:hypothetical protein